jgi:hypothetical protein
MEKVIPLEIKVQDNSQSCLSACIKWNYFFLRREEVDEVTLHKMAVEAQKQTYHYLNLSPEKKAQFEEDVFIDGAAMVALTNYLDLRGFMSRHGSQETLEWFISRDIPVIIDIQNFRRKLEPNPDISKRYPHGHYVIANGIKGNRVNISDPGNANHLKFSVPYGELERRWFDPTPKDNHLMLVLMEPENKIKIPFKGRYI